MLYSCCPSKKREPFQWNNSEMPRMSSYSFLKFERYPTGNRHSLDIPNRIHSPHGKKVTSQRVSCSISRHPRLACTLHVRVAHTRPADAHVHVIEARPGSPDAPFQHAALRRTAAALQEIWVIRKRLQGSCRGNFSFRFVSLKNHAGKRREREIAGHLREASFAKFTEFANWHKGKIQTN